MNKNMGIPWVEKYRPKKFENIILDPINKKLLENIMKYNYFPNLLLYGPPGTGKTTTIINLIKRYQEINNQNRKNLKIHLNASDDRGIDIIRHQITEFVNANSLFINGLKFVILDEVDYMTKNAQQALKYLIQTYSNNVRYCLICNYISRIDISLKNEFIHLRFCKVPSNEINKFLKNIVKQENILITNTELKSIQNTYNTDIRSMINYIQSNYHSLNKKKLIINDDKYELLITKFKNKDKNISKYILDISYKYEIEINKFIIKFIYYLINNYEHVYNYKWLNNFEFLVHNNNQKDDYLINYFISSFIQLYDLS